MLNSSEAYFAAVRQLISALKNSGNAEDAEEIAQGLACINGLTDGWALHLEALLRVAEDRHRRLTPAQQTQLNELCDWAYKTVYRRDRLATLFKRFLSFAKHR